MREKGSTDLGKKRAYWLMGFSLVAILAILGPCIHGINQEVRQFSLLKDGVQTCFDRVGQSFTAKMLGQQWSKYLKATFMKTTEECLGEVMASAEQKQKSIWSSLSTQRLNTLSANAHWFHEKLNVSTLSGSTMLSEINNRFTQLETLKNQILDDFDGAHKKAVRFWPVILGCFYLMILAIPWWIFRGMLAERRRRMRLNALDQEARHELQKGTPWSLLKVEKLVRRGLEENELEGLGSLFSNFFMDLVDGKIRISPPHEDLANLPFKGKEKTQETYSDITFVHAESSADIDPPPLPIRAAPMIQETPSLSTLTGIPLHKLLHQVLDMHSAKFFSLGVKLNFTDQEEVFIAGDREAVEQLIFQAMDAAINAVSEDQDHSLQITYKKIDSNSVLDFIYTGAVANNPARRMALEIVRELAKDMNIQFAHETLKAEENSAGGEKTRLVFKLAEKRNFLPSRPARLMNISKGRKKELLQEL
jgi:hypothetical protein